MDLVSFDTKGEYEMFAEIMARGIYDHVVQNYTIVSVVLSYIIL